MGKLFIIVGIVLVLVGVGLTFKDQVPLFKYLGKLPGDIHYKKGNTSFYFPITTGILISIILSILFNIFNKMR